MVLSVERKELLRNGEKLTPLSGEDRIGTGLLTPEQRDAGEILHDALADQISLMVSGRFDVFRGVSGDGFLKTFKRDPLFMEVYQMAQVEALKMTDDREFAKRLGGALFSKMGYARLSSQANRPVLLSPSDTFDVSRALHPNAEIIIDPFENLGLRGIYVPDGYRVGEDGKIVEVLEYSAGEYKPRALSQATGFLYVVEELGALAHNPSFVELTRRTVDVSARIEKIPFGRDFYEKFKKDIYWNFRLSEGASTLSELRQQWHKSTAGQQYATGEPSFFPK